MNVPRRGIGPATEAALQAHADRQGFSLRERCANAGDLGFGPKLTASILELSGLLDDAPRPRDHGAR